MAVTSSSSSPATGDAEDTALFGVWSAPIHISGCKSCCAPATSLGIVAGDSMYNSLLAVAGILLSSATRCTDGDRRLVFTHLRRRSGLGGALLTGLVYRLLSCGCPIDKSQTQVGKFDCLNGLHTRDVPQVQLGMT